MKKKYWGISAILMVVSAGMFLNVSKIQQADTKSSSDYSDIDICREQQRPLLVDNGLVALDIEFLQDQLYVSSGTSIEIYNAQNPLAPEIVSVIETSAITADIEVSGQGFLAFAQGDIFTLYNVSDPQNLYQLGFLELGETIQHIEVVGLNKFAAASQNSLFLIDVSNPAEPILASQYPSQGIVKMYSGFYEIYLAKENGGFDVVHIQPFESPALVESVEVDGQVTSFARIYQYLFVGVQQDQKAKILVYDVTTNTNLSTLVHQMELTGQPNQTVLDVKLQENFMLVSLLGGDGAKLMAYEMQNHDATTMTPNAVFYGNYNGPVMDAEFTTSPVIYYTQSSDGFVIETLCPKDFVRPDGDISKPKDVKEKR